MLVRPIAGDEVPTRHIAVLCDAMRENDVLFAAAFDLESLTLTESLEPELAELPRQSDGYQDAYTHLFY
tara:strand:- start:582 stop:788 length:207 start_codon:yes stop_codon:yes gene_type:complete